MNRMLAYWEKLSFVCLRSVPKLIADSSITEIAAKNYKTFGLYNTFFSETKRPGQSDSRKKPRFSKGSKENQYRYPVESNNNNL